MSASNYRRASLVMATTMFIAACSMAPPYQRPVAPVADQWPAVMDPVRGAQLVQQDGWRAFVIDEDLRRFVDVAIGNNRDLRTALLNVEAARAQYRIERSDQLPAVDATASGVRQRLSPASNLEGVGGVQESFQSGVALAAFELDLFGRLRSLSDAALHEYLATEEAARSAEVSLVSEVARAYLLREGAFRQLMLTQEIVDTRREAFERIAARRTAGVASALEQEEAETLANQAKADLVRLDRQYRQATNALVLLIGTRDALTELKPGFETDAPVVAELEPGAPSELLASRPDVRAAERRLQARNADIGAARAAFFPRIALTGSAGSASAEFSELYGSNTRVWSFSPQITLPIFSGGRNRANLNLAEARKDIAVAEYEKSIQVAFQEVADAIAARETLETERQALSAVIRNSATAARLSEARYRAGLDSYLRYLDAQRTLYAAQIEEIDVEVQRQIALTQLFRAMGGRWYAPVSGGAVATRHQSG
ncbi:efflux transporter outer membrane subunit [Luteimonas deserti]|uniref:Efflux transporter outer membrane subunit n=1 Tax=Luteimonas deserti TaxID=2752306 RepID=A0A7Z0TV94_9GAMM|nr:efflux transporter outer membrane subunit [Luteimonas deserti]NYZ62014.1 efflux transporter outer membrane subunit [Luteimonas deserti]